MYNVQIFPAKPSSCWENQITSLLLKKGCFQQNCVTGVSYIRLKKKTKELHWLLLERKQGRKREKVCKHHGVARNRFHCSSSLSFKANPKPPVARAEKEFVSLKKLLKHAVNAEGYVLTG